MLLYITLYNKQLNELPVCSGAQKGCPLSAQNLKSTSATFKKHCTDGDVELHLVFLVPALDLNQSIGLT